MRISWILIAILMIGIIGTVSAVSSGNLGNSNLCKKECMNDKKAALHSCVSENIECRQSCQASKEACLIENKNSKNKTKICNNYACMKECAETKNICNSLAVLSNAYCPQACNAGNMNVTCGDYNAGESFVNGTEMCGCNYKGEIVCKKNNALFARLTSFDSNECNNGGGLFQQLCNGPYFDIVCTGKNYCLCSGNGNNSCPSNSACLTNFDINVRKDTVAGWKNYIGEDLGNIGICVKGAVNSCGNGICEEITCLSDNCPFPENSLNCPQDCSN
jgi:hypothetical protein